MESKFRNEKSWNGLSLDVLKSGLQKYIRRGKKNKAIWCGIELYMFICDGNGQRIITNFIHRLMVIYLEDIGIADIENWKKVDSMIDILLLKAKDKNMMTLKSKTIIELISYMSLTKHSRSPSHFNSLYIIDDKKVLNKIKKYLHHFPTINSLINKKINDSRETIILIDEFKKSINDNNMWSIYYARKIHAECTPAVASKNIFGILEKSGKIKDEYIKLGKKWFKELKSIKECFLTYAIPILSINLNKKEKEDASSCNIIIKEVDNWKDYYFKNIRNILITIDDYVIDMHTKKGRIENKNGSDFIMEGAVVNNEFILNSEFKDFYEFLKLFKENIIDDKYTSEKIEIKPIKIIEKPIINTTTKESERFKFIVRAQLVTSASKMDTYYAYDIYDNNNIVFVKGPYIDKKTANVAITSLNIKKLLNIAYLDIKLVELIPDLLNTPLGLRNKLDKKKTYPFLIFENLCDELLITTHSSKLWPETEIVDWDNMTTCNTFKVMDIKTKDINKNIKYIKQYIVLILYRYIIGCGDLADRNFLYSKKYDTIYSVDEDKIEDDFNMFNLKKNKSKFVYDFIINNKKYFDDILNNWRILLSTDKDKNNYKYMLNKLNNINYELLFVQ